MLCSVLPPFKLKAKLSNYDMPGFLSFCEVHGGIFADLPGEVLEKNNFCQWPHQSHFLKMIFWRKHPAHWQHQCHQDLFQILFQIFHSFCQLDHWLKSQGPQTDFLSSTLLATGSIFSSLACLVSLLRTAHATSVPVCVHGTTELLTAASGSFYHSPQAGM